MWIGFCHKCLYCEVNYNCWELLLSFQRRQYLDMCMPGNSVNLILFFVIIEIIMHSISFEQKFNVFVIFYIQDIFSTTKCIQLQFNSISIQKYICFLYIFLIYISASSLFYSNIYNIYNNEQIFQLIKNIFSEKICFYINIKLMDYNGIYKYDKYMNTNY